jgi:type II secretory pathway pseudopilin PulG
MIKKKAQIWVETAIYTLIGITIMGIILAMAIPQIEKIKDKSIVEQTVSALQTLDLKIQEVEQTEGRVGKVVFKIAKGSLKINSTNDSIVYVLEDTNLEASQPGVEIKNGNIILKTEKVGAKFRIILRLNYSRLNITYKDGENLGTINAGATPYNIFIENKGAESIGSKTKLDFNVV